MNPDITPQQKTKIERTGTFAQNKDLGMFAVMQDVAESLDKLAGAKTVRIEGKQGEQGDKGEKGDKGDQGKEGKEGKQGKEGKKGEKGDRGLKGEDGVDGKDGENGKMGVIDEATIAYLENEIKRLSILIEESKTTTTGTQRVGWGAHPLQIQAGGVIKEKVARIINFVGAGVNSVVRTASGVVTVTINGGGSGSTVYSETPTGAIDGVNKVYTTAQTITTIQLFAINGQFIHPAEYSVVGSTITFVTALPASLSGLAFTIIYV